ncbi:DUF2726 domain-containing protein [Photobacterium damselae]|uniref:DUF2726 domain-containing protein n=1 Tax=Photobacterium damselae TaxID=38293 RepID=UPI0040686466
MYKDLINLIVIVVIVLIGLRLLRSLSSVSRQKGLDKYRKQEALLTPAELNFYHALKQTIPENCVLSMKVRVADVLKVERDQANSDNKAWFAAFRKISQKHFDFVVCKSEDMSYVCAIELNDRSHQRKERIERDEFLRSACNTAKLPLIEIIAAKSYDVDELSQQIYNAVDNVM